MLIMFLAHMPVFIISIIVGIVLQHADIIHIQLHQIILICFLTAIIYFVTRHNIIRLCCALLISSLCGALLWAHYNQKQLRYEYLFSNYTLDIIGIVVDKEPLENTFQLVLRVTAVRTTLNNNWQNINTHIAIRATQEQVPEIGDTITLLHLSCCPLNASLSTWLRKHNYSGIAFYTASITITHHPYCSIKNMCWHIKHLIKERAKAKLNQQAYGLFSALFLGKPDNDNPYAYHQSFSWWGLNHYLARAGLHLVILFLILNILITFFTSRFITKTIINLALAIFYCIFTWQNIPFVRAFLVLVGHYTCNILKVPCSILHLLNLVIFFYLLLNPQALFFLDFQLTFAITYTLILIGRLTKIRASL